MMQEAAFFHQLDELTVQCDLCPLHCRIHDGHDGICRSRKNIGGSLIVTNYGKVCAMHVDPIEKKPLFHYRPGQEILSLGNNGCNLACRFCQNWQISQSPVATRDIPPKDLLALTQARKLDMVAFTYAEPLIWFEYIMDCARILRENGIRVILVSNGMINREPFLALRPWIDAMNIDIKSMDDAFYRNLCNGRLQPVLDTCRLAAETMHLEITNLVITGENDSENRFHELGRFIANELGPDTPLHLSRYFPSYQMTHPPTPINTLHRAAEITRQYLHFVFVGNIHPEESSDSRCPTCGHLLIQRRGYTVGPIDLDNTGRCPQCGFDPGIVLT
ncbi:AmmeMemoRadiSam system radical SAM enzyme [bacterium]|nr:AmmeMemoRadiSam system radical SAM enzyme [candidate division CSSED10-310 bacterium]